MECATLISPSCSCEREKEGPWSGSGSDIPAVDHAIRSLVVTLAGMGIESSLQIAQPGESTLLGVWIDTPYAITIWLVSVDIRGHSSSVRALAQHAGGTGIDALSLHQQPGSGFFVVGCLVVYLICFGLLARRRRLLFWDHCLFDSVPAL